MSALAHPTSTAVRRGRGLPRRAAARSAAARAAASSMAFCSLSSRLLSDCAFCFSAASRCASSWYWASASATSFCCAARCAASAAACCSRCGPGRLQRLLFGGDRILQLLQFRPGRPSTAARVACGPAGSTPSTPGRGRCAPRPRRPAAGAGPSRGPAHRWRAAGRRSRRAGRPALLQLAALLLQRQQLLLAGGDRGIGFAYGAGGASQRVGLLCQFRVDAVAPGGGVRLLLGQRCHLVADVGQFLLRLGLLALVFRALADVMAPPQVKRGEHTAVDGRAVRRED